MLKIMLVDDSSVDRVTLSRLLQHKGYEVVTAADAGKALEVLRHDLPDLVVLDVAMPGMDGLQLLELLHENETWRTLPVIMLTGVSDTFAIQRAERLGAKEYMVKATFSVAQLLDTVGKYLQPLQ